MKPGLSSLMKPIASLPNEAGTVVPNEAGRFAP